MREQSRARGVDGTHLGMRVSLGKGTKLSFETRRTVTYTLLSVLAATVVGGGCSSESSNLVGAGLGSAVIDTVLKELVVEELVHFGQLDVIDPDEPLDEAEVLYIGSRDGDVSSILANYDFSVFDHPDSAYLVPFITASNVATVDLKLITLEWYDAYHGDDPDDDDGAHSDLWPWEGAEKHIEVKPLHAPFDTLRFPADELPDAYDPIGTSEAVLGGESYIDLAESQVIQWFVDRAEVGLLLQEEPNGGSDPGLIGFAGRDMAHGGSALPPLSQTAETTLGPALRIKLMTTPESWVSDREYLIIPPSADVSTWHQLHSVPSDGVENIVIRSHLRSYPVLQFDLSGLPEGARINQAEIVLHLDQTTAADGLPRTHGPIAQLVSASVDNEIVANGQRLTLTLDDLGGASRLVGGGAVQPELMDQDFVGISVTSELQRYVNGATDNDFAFLLAEGERIFPGYISNPGPGFWFGKMVFHGTSATDATLRPRLEILYTAIDAAIEPEVR